MVNISSQNNKINVTVSSSGNTANTNVTPDYAQYYSEKSKGIPNLLKNTNGEYIKDNDKVYLPTDTGVSILPESLNWVNLCILHQDYIDELIRQIQNKYLEKWEQIKQEIVKAVEKISPVN